MAESAASNGASSTGVPLRDRRRRALVEAGAARRVETRFAETGGGGIVNGPSHGPLLQLVLGASRRREAGEVALGIVGEGGGVPVGTGQGGDQ